MNPITRFVRWLYDLDLDLLAAVVGLGLALLLFPLRFLSSQIYIVTLPIVLGVGCILYILAYRSDESRDQMPRLAGWVADLLPAAFFFLLSAMVVLAFSAWQRSVPFMLVGGLTGTLLLTQVLLVDDRDLRPGLVLTEIVVYAFVVRFSALYTAPGYIGIDVWSHTHFARLILEQNSLSAISPIKYYSSPLYHLLTVAGVKMAGVSMRNAIYLTLGVAMPLVALLVYGTARMLVPLRWALAAAAVYAMGDQVIRWGIHLIPSSMGLLFFLACFYLLVRLLHASNQWRDLGLLVFFSVAVILTHQISSFIMVTLMLAGLAAQVLMRFDLFTKDSQYLSFPSGAAATTNLAGLAVFDFGVMMFTWSLTPYKGDTFLETVINYLYVNLFNAGFLSGVGGGGSPAASAGGNQGAAPLVATLNTYLETVGFLLLIFLAVMGCLAVLDRRRSSQSTYTLVIAIVGMLFVVLGLPLFGIESFVPGRWVAFLYAPMAVVGIVGLRHVSHRVSFPVVAVVLVLFAVAYPGAMIMSNDGAMDSPVFPSQHERLAYTETELAAVQTVGDVRGPDQTNGPFYTDHPYGTVWERTGAHNAKFIEYQNGSPTLRGTTVYRSYQSHGGSFFKMSNNKTAIRNPPESAVCPPSSTQLYDNGDVVVCTPAGLA